MEIRRFFHRAAPILAGLAAFGSAPFYLSAAPPSADSSHLLVPGKQVGHLFVGKHTKNGLSALSKPTVLDVGMSQTRQVWVSKGNAKQTLFLHTISNGAVNAKPTNGVIITSIRVTAPSFHTTGGVHTGMIRRAIQKQFPRLRRDAIPNESVIYADAAKGIAFEFGKDTAEAKCIGITVFVPDLHDNPASGEAIRGSDVARLLHDNPEKSAD